ncbi:hypothetical protein [Burkholderia cenocepacia]|uniref:hypothetical protein n=1 Tax=Burkholderia cenocepacia TaxID=95486 RepID=UPI002ABE29DB|nr:hypothetical protein [Burkholderia cenocepacia]
MFAKDIETSALLREATRLSDTGDLDKAIACLQETHRRMAISPVSYPVETWLRLPLYLQKAGRFAEAMDEFAKLVANTPTRIAREQPHLSAAKHEKFVKQDIAIIEGKIRLASEREAKTKARKTAKS